MVLHLISGAVSNVSTSKSDGLDCMSSTELLCERNTFLTVVDAAEERTRHAIIRRVNSESDLSSSNGSATAWRVAHGWWSHPRPKDSCVVLDSDGPRFPISCEGGIDHPRSVRSPCADVKKSVVPVLTQWECAPCSSDPDIDDVGERNQIASYTSCPSGLKNGVALANLSQQEKSHIARDAESGKERNHDIALGQQHPPGKKNKGRCSRPCKAMRKKCQHIADSIDVESAASVGRDLAQSNRYLATCLAAKARTYSIRVPGLQQHEDAAVGRGVPQLPPIQRVGSESFVFPGRNFKMSL